MSRARVQEAVGVLPQHRGAGHDHRHDRRTAPLSRARQWSRRPVWHRHRPQGFQWQELVNVTRKAEWRDWVPPPERIERQPYQPRLMAGGPGNPLGTRAMDL